MSVAESLLIIVVILVVWFYIFTHSHPDLECESLDVLMRDKKFKTGDIILFKAVDNYNAPMIASYYGHIGIVWVDPKDPTQTPYIFEAANPTNLVLEANQNPKGIYVSPLENRIKKYKGYTFYKELGHKINDDVCEEFERFIQYCVDHMEYETRVISNGIRKGLFGEKINNKVNCGEIVMLSLIKLDLLPNDAYEKRMFHHLRWMCSITDVRNNYYEEPVKILYHPF